MKKSAFTLAEVLLTLAIIGVVAALTIPAVVTKATKEQYVTGLKKAYNTLKAVERETIRENGPTVNWNWTLSIEDSFERYFKPHFDILKSCGITDNKCFSTEIKSLSGDTTYNISGYSFATSDGMAFVYIWYGAINTTVSFFVDVNGTKGPNTLGRDIFVFYLFNTSGIKPSGTFMIISNSNEEIRVPSSEIDAATGSGCNPNGGDGLYCAAKVLAEGAMNY